MLTKKHHTISQSKVKRLYIIFKKKKFKNKKMLHKYKYQLVNWRGFYTYVSPYHMFSKKHYLLSPFRYLDFSQNRHSKKNSQIWHSYGDIFWTYILLFFILFDLYWFVRIFRRSISREKSTKKEKSFLKKNIKSAYSTLLYWDYASWEYYDINGVHKYTWWCFAQFSSDFFGSDEFIENYWKNFPPFLKPDSDFWFYNSQHLFSKFYVKQIMGDHLELKRTAIGEWHSLREDFDLLGTYGFEPTIFPDSYWIPIDWWFYFYC